MKVLDILTVFKDFLRAEDDFQQISSGITSYKGKHWFRAVQFRLSSRNVNSRDDQILYTLYYYQTLSQTQYLNAEGLDANKAQEDDNQDINVEGFQKFLDCQNVEKI